MWAAKAPLAVVFVAFALRDVGRADRLDGWWLRARFSARERLQPRRPPDSDIALVEIDDRSVNRWKEPLVFWTPHLTAAARAAHRGGARLLALDWIAPIAGREWLRGDYARLLPLVEKREEELGAALGEAGNVVLVKQLQLLPDGSARWIRPPTELLFALPDTFDDPEAHLGYAELRGEDTVTSAMTPVVANGDGTHEISFAARIVERYFGKKGNLRAQRWSVPGQTAVPLRADGSLLLNFANHTGALTPARRGGFARYSLYDVAQPGFDADAAFRGKIVLIGATYSGVQDDHLVPFLNGFSRARNVPGVEVQANAVRTLLGGAPVREPGPLLFWVVALAPGVLGVLAFTRLNFFAAALLSLFIALGWIALSFAMFAASSYALPISAPLIGLFLGAIIMAEYRAIGEERERRQVLGLWGRYQDPRQVEYLLRHPQARGGQGQETEATVLFADLQNFTKTVEHLEPGEALRVLNRYLALMTEVIRDEYGGFVDKYLGDGLMAQWGAPPPWQSARGDEHHAETAVRACLELERRIAALSRTAGDERDVTFGLRLTLHTGPVVVGWVGASRLEFTIIGDTVNVTARLQETAKQLGCSFLISETIFEQIRGRIRIGKRAQVEIRGREQPLRVYEVLGEADA
jgi:class 3 adenylate cyclase/CHASE2 domain-containing sensor protein